MRDAIYHCPVEVTMEVLGGKWTCVVLSHLKESPRRYAELRRLIPGITEKMLAQRLRFLEGLGMVERTVVSATPPHVTYEFSERGRSLAPALQALYDWGQTYAAQTGLTIEPVRPTT